MCPLHCWKPTARLWAGTCPVTVVTSCDGHGHTATIRQVLHSYMHLIKALLWLAWSELTSASRRMSPSKRERPRPAHKPPSSSQLQSYVAEHSSFPVAVTAADLGTGQSNVSPTK